VRDTRGLAGSRREDRTRFLGSGRNLGRDGPSCQLSDTLAARPCLPQNATIPPYNTHLSNGLSRSTVPFLITASANARPQQIGSTSHFQHLQPLLARVALHSSPASPSPRPPRPRCSLGRAEHGARVTATGPGGALGLRRTSATAGVNPRRSSAREGEARPRRRRSRRRRAPPSPAGKTDTVKTAALAPSSTRQEADRQPAETAPKADAATARRL